MIGPDRRNAAFLLRSGQGAWQAVQVSRVLARIVA
jgi:hypothetical protein